ncbi:MAG: aldo/keto reductase [Spirochaetales bacterium]|nr:aldo/keto reductase [Spirochaetales bacterium]
MTHATPEGTAGFFKKRNYRNEAFLEETWHARLPSGLTVSRLGAGTYRMAAGIKSHAEALREALLSGINVIDMALNFAHGKALDLVGAVLGELMVAGRLRRDECVLLLKVGLVEGPWIQALGRYPLTWLNAEEAYSIHPDALRSGLDLCLERLGQRCIDILYLQNPEWLWQKGLPAGELKAQLADAFATCEDLRKQKKIQHYGISVSDLSLFTAIPPREMLALAGPGFLSFQYPCNLLEQEMHRTFTSTLRELKRLDHVYLAGQRPLNASDGGQICRLAESMPIIAPEALQAALMQDLTDLRRLEMQFMAETGFQFDGRFPALSVLYENFRQQIVSREHFRANRSLLAGTVSRTLSALRRTGGGKEQIEFYRQLCNQMLLRWEKASALRGLESLRELRKKLDATMPGLPLAVQAILPLLRNGPQTILVGMRRPEYVKQLTGMFAAKPPEESPFDRREGAENVIDH